MDAQTCIVLRVKDSPALSNAAQSQKTSIAWPEDELLICHGESQYLRNLPEFFSSKQLSLWDQNVKWYLENYVTSEPFASARATSVEEYIRNYTSQLALFLPIEEVLPQNIDHVELVLEVEDYSISGSRISQIHWELLENTKFWATNSSPQTVTVIRLAKPSSCLVRGTLSGGDGSYQQGCHRSKNILVVTARRGSNDVPHRMISRHIVDVVASLPPAAIEHVSLKILRPGTFAALEKELSFRKHGFYDTVHIDMHGSSSEHGERIPAQDVARILAQYGVNTVILNACQSAVEDGNADSNLAKHLTRSGITSVVAMSFNVLDRAAMIFTKAFYQQYVTNQCSVWRSVQSARKALRTHAMRQSKYGTSVDVLDFFVPKLYQIHGTSDWKSSQIERTDPLSGVEIIGDTRKLELVGREELILQIENSLMNFSPVIRIQGPPGAGKSFLVSHLRTWWKKTDLVKHTVTVDPGESSDLNFETFLTMIYDQLSENETHVGTDAMISYIRSKQCLIVFDSFERYVHAVRRFQESFMTFLKKICRSRKNYVLILSRYLQEDEEDEEDWLVSSAPVLFSLQNLDLKSSLLLASQCLEQQPANSGHEAFEFSRCLEFLVCLGQGNPLAIILLIRRLCSQPNHIKDYCAGLLGSHDFKIPAGDQFLQNNVDFRCINELRNLIAQDPIRRTAFLQNLERTGQLVMRIDYLRSFWGCIAKDELRRFLRFLVEVHKRMSRLSVLEMLQAKSVLNSVSGFNNSFEEELVHTGEVKGTGLREQIEAFATDEHLKSFFVVLKPFVAAGFCNPAMEHELNLGGTKLRKCYFEIHPLLTLVLRESQHGLMRLSPFAGLKSLTALTRCLASRTAKYPVQQMYWHQDWALPKLEIEIEYLNFFSAAAGSSVLDLGSRETMHTNLKTCVQLIEVLRFALGPDTRRETVMVYLQEICETKFSEHIREMISAQNRLVFIFAALTARLLAVFLGVDRTTKITSSWSEVFSRSYCVDLLEMHSMMLILSIYNYYLEYGFEEAELWKTRAEKLYKTRSFAGIMGPRKRKVMKFFADPILHQGDAPEGNMQSERTDFLSWYQSETGIDTSQPQTGDPELDRYNVHLGAPLADQWAPTLQAKILARREFQRGNFSAAREILETALSREAQHHGRPNVCAPLYASLAEIAETVGDINLAIEHLERAISLEVGASRENLDRQAWLRRLRDKMQK